ncbi:MAG: helix-turn-helix transcriptional regulator [Clostridia bacterium]|nr:helix-turn-helix transcriptional regulator [Clostridia bacterium]
MFTYNISTLPKVSMSGKTREKQGWSHSGRQMQYNLFVYFHSGECVFDIGGVEYEYKKGNIAIVPKNTPYRPYTDSGTEYTFFHFDGELCECTEADIPNVPLIAENEKTPIYGVMSPNAGNLIFDTKMDAGEEASEIEMLLTKCVNSKFRHGNSADLLISLYFCEVLFHASRAFRTRFEGDESHPPAVNRIIAYINANYTRKISLDELCAELNMSKQYCMRIFKKHMHSTINDYVLATRMKHAAYCLRHTYMNVNETANYLGFSSVSYFSRVFKDYYGVAPSEFFE